MQQGESGEQPHHGEVNSQAQQRGTSSTHAEQAADVQKEWGEGVDSSVQEAGMRGRHSGRGSVEGEGMSAFTLSASSARSRSVDCLTRLTGGKRLDLTVKGVFVCVFLSVCERVLLCDVE